MVVCNLNKNVIIAERAAAAMAINEDGKQQKAATEKAFEGGKELFMALQFHTAVASVPLAHFIHLYADNGKFIGILNQLTLLRVCE